MPNFQCDQCGACCRKLIIEIDWLDIQREPSFREVTKPFKIGPGEASLDENDEPIENPDPYMAGAMLACGSSKPCPKQVGNQCSIYPSRPNVCVAFEAGSEQCQDARRAEGLADLTPTTHAAH